jgi:hypothetical protein
MQTNDIYDSRDLNCELNDEDNCIHWNESFGLMKQFNYTTLKLIGGGLNECLKELILGIQSMDIKYTLMREFVY